MKPQDTHLINITFLENRLGELGLKNWWVAENIGVDRKTLSRWLSGKVRTIKDENLQALAKCLNCTPGDLTLKDESEVIATKEEQSIAAQLIVQENLLGTLAPLDQWPLLESIVKTSMQPNLPLPVMGKLYNLLSICSWRQSKMDKALAFAGKALELGEKIGHRGVIAQAHNNQAIVASYQGRLQDSIALYESVIQEKNFIEEDRTVAAAFSNLGQDYQSFGDLTKSRQMQNEAIRLYTQLNLPLNMSIAYCALGLLETELENYEQAIEALKKALDLAIQANYIRGISAYKVYWADCLARSGNLSEAKKLLDEGFEGFQKINVHEALNYEIKGRYFRLIGDVKTADSSLQEGLLHGKEFPLELASLYREYAKLYPDQASEFLSKAKAIYKRAGASRS